jgi:hypothetical protein
MKKRRAGHISADATLLHFYNGGALRHNLRRVGWKKTHRRPPFQTYLFKQDGGQGVSPTFFWQFDFRPGGTVSA